MGLLKKLASVFESVPPEPERFLGEGEDAFLLANGSTAKVVAVHGHGYGLRYTAVVEGVNDGGRRTVTGSWSEGHMPVVGDTVLLRARPDALPRWKYKIFAKI